MADASVCAILFDFANAKQLRLTPTLSNCDALLSMLANASLIVFACQQTIGAKPLILLANASLVRFCLGWMANSS
ncbi:hypothetical protein [Helicobacter pylori]|uniref:hypothetical protein n=1 Tax=Helicobacter pylori TaxID=210 RepID=UPI0013E3AB96|nr:hypothetical protein [Helicobacter pylori]